MVRKEKTKQDIENLMDSWNIYKLSTLYGQINKCFIANESRFADTFFYWIYWIHAEPVYCGSWMNSALGAITQHQHTQVSGWKRLNGTSRPCRAPAGILLSKAGGNFVNSDGAIFFPPPLLASIDFGRRRGKHTNLQIA